MPSASRPSREYLLSVSASTSEPPLPGSERDGSCTCDNGDAERGLPGERRRAGIEERHACEQSAGAPHPLRFLSLLFAFLRALCPDDCLCARREQGLHLPHRREEDARFVRPFLRTAERESDSGSLTWGGDPPRRRRQ